MPFEQSTSRGAMSVADFCSRHDISRQTFYALLRDGHGPNIMKIRRRTLVSDEAAAEWRTSMTAATMRTRETHTNACAG